MSTNDYSNRHNAAAAKWFRDGAKGSRSSFGGGRARVTEPIGSGPYVIDTVPKGAAQPHGQAMRSHCQTGGRTDAARHGGQSSRRRQIIAGLRRATAPSALTSTGCSMVRALTT